MPMNTVEIITIGDELLRGEIVDGNASWLSGRLFALGATVSRIGSVGDQTAQITKSLREATARCDVLLVTGGLGATDDDNTMRALADVIGVGVHADKNALDAACAWFARAKSPVADTARMNRLAEIPIGADALVNPVGVAPGVEMRVGRCHVYCMPGVPQEMRAMFDQVIVPRIREVLALVYPRKRKYRLFGLPESLVNDRLQGVTDDCDLSGVDVGIHYRVTKGEVHVSLIVRPGGVVQPDGGVCEESAIERLFSQLSGRVESRLADYLYGTDDTTFGDAVVGALRRANAKVALAESCTGGLVGEMLTQIPGSSRVFECGVIAYANYVKQALLGVSSEVLDRDGAVSRACVEQMAQGIRMRTGADFGLAISGIAGPDGGTAEKPVGTVHFALADIDGTRHLQRLFPYDRQRNKQLAAYVALWMLLCRLRGADRQTAAHLHESDDILGGRWRP